MGTLIGIIVLVIIFYVMNNITEWKFDNRTPPPGQKTDWAAMNRDMVNGMSKQSVMSKANRGGYNIPKDN